MFHKSSQNHLEGSVTRLMTFADVSQKGLGPLPIYYIVIQQMVQMAFCDLSHAFHKQATSVSQHVFVILLWGILKSPLRGNVKMIWKWIGNGDNCFLIPALLCLRPALPENFKFTRPRGPIIGFLIGELT